MMSPNKIRARFKELGITQVSFAARHRIKPQSLCGVIARRDKSLRIMTALAVELFPRTDPRKVWGEDFTPHEPEK